MIILLILGLTISVNLTYAEGNAQQGKSVYLAMSGYGTTDYVKDAPDY